MRPTAPTPFTAPPGNPPVDQAEFLRRLSELDRVLR